MVLVRAVVGELLQTDLVVVSLGSCGLDRAVVARFLRLVSRVPGLDVI